MRSIRRFIFTSNYFEITVANLPTTAFLASISYQVDVIWSFFKNFDIVRGLILSKKN